MTKLYDIRRYLEVTGRKLKSSEFDAAIAMAARGKRIAERITLPVENGPAWRLLHERY